MSACTRCGGPLDMDHPRLCESCFTARMVEVMAEEVIDGSTGWWWLSYCDASLPEGSQFLGVCVVEGDGVMSANLRTHALGINPGGEVAAAAIPPEHVPPPEYRNRLLSRAEAEAL